MSRLREVLDEEYKKSLKEKNAIKTKTLRLVKSAIKNKDISLRTSDNKNVLSDGNILKLLQNLIKKRNEAIEMFKKGGRINLAEDELKEIEIIKNFLPTQFNEEKTREIIQKIVKSENLSSIKDMGKLLGILKEKYTGKIEVSIAARLAKEVLN